MSIIIFFSASKHIFFCRNDVQAIDFLRKGSYPPDIIKDHRTNVLCILHVGKNVRVKLEKKIIISCNFGTLLFYTLISSNTTLRYMFAQGRKDGWTNADHYYVTPLLRGGGQKRYTG